MCYVRAVSRLELPIEGMTCAGCANTVERSLNELEGVRATVNYATEKAAVEFDDGAVAPEQLLAAVESAGYSAALPDDAPAAGGDEPDPLLQRLQISALLTLPVLVLAMVPPLQFDNWQWLSLTLAAPVVVWGALPFHRAAWANLRRATATMDTLISVGVLRGVRLVAVRAVPRTTPACRACAWSCSWSPTGRGSSEEIYLEVASAVTVFILAGRYFEARAKRRAGAALRSLLELGAKERRAARRPPRPRRGSRGRRPLPRAPG